MKPLGIMVPVARNALEASWDNATIAQNDLKASWDIGPNRRKIYILAKFELRARHAHMNS